MPELFSLNNPLHQAISFIAAYVSLFAIAWQILKRRFKNYKKSPKLKSTLDQHAKSTAKNPWRIAQIQSQVTFRIVCSAAYQVMMCVFFAIWLITLQQEYKFFELSDSELYLIFGSLSALSFYFTTSASYSLLVLKTAADMKDESLKEKLASQ
ncbi:hypothetical protein [Vibrio parahaemolyticus]|uniref:hypothetical protein n=1 Tax=Vibrio parahaemolyticus TaxID=670 RepID=UPI00111D1D6E|nr:hypothetical protein [Vibrio parahaemolyticus]MCQ9100226.1 hypothetical protein [Vibrio parahaemolyticus]MDL2009731.1 hypothetical protein [Vibrio parahaemolyticus]TON79040.1 hypothetical protein CGH49_23675 [Vibrio parahaemolyticus]HCG6696608.1 hypothetical protein [Vibrio parahaemolyticus]